MKKLWFVLPILLIAIFVTACDGSFLARPETPASSENIQVSEVIDVEQQFIKAYQAGNLTTQDSQTLNPNDLKIRFESWLPNGKYMLLQVKTGEVLEGKLPSDPPNSNWGPAIIGITDLWLADINGIPLVLLAEAVSWNSWSPDGTTIAYIHEFVENDFIISELWVVQPDGSNRKKLSSNANNLAWLDNKTIVFIDTDNKLQLIDRDGQNVRPFMIEGLASENSKVVLYALSPDRQKLAFDARGDSKIRIADMADGRAKVVTEIETPDLSRLSWSPDSKRLAFSYLCSKPQQNPACQQIHIVQVDGVVETQIDHRLDTNVTWSPDGQWLAFQESNKVYVADTTSGKVQLLHTFPAGKHNSTETIHWSPMGKRIGLNQESDGVATILSLQD